MIHGENIVGEVVGCGVGNGVGNPVGCGVGLDGAGVGALDGGKVMPMQTLKPAPCEVRSEWNLKVVVPETARPFAGNASRLLDLPQYWWPSTSK